MCLAVVIMSYGYLSSLESFHRFILLKHVRKDLIKDLPLPQRLQSYLSTPYYYTEEINGYHVMDDKPPPEPLIPSILR